MIPDNPQWCIRHILLFCFFLFRDTGHYRPIDNVFSKYDLTYMAYFLSFINKKNHTSLLMNIYFRSFDPKASNNYCDSLI